jgi:hypothetical protein
MDNREVQYWTSITKTEIEDLRKLMGDDPRWERFLEGVAHTERCLEDPKLREYAARAKEEFQCDDLSLDEDPLVADSEEGAFVMAWVFVENEEGEHDEDMV